MKPKEFDELIRQKFDQNDFEFNPRNWDQLVEELDGRAKKRSMIMWWWMPLAGVAASVALAMGVTFLGSRVNDGPSFSDNSSLTINKEIALYSIVQPFTPGIDITLKEASHVSKPAKNPSLKTEPEYSFAIRLQSEATTRKEESTFNFLKADKKASEIRKKQPALTNAVTTFKPEYEEAKAPKLSIILNGGVSHGANSSGYAAGATIRRMINDKLYFESDVAYSSNNNAQSVQYVNMQSSARHAVARGTLLSGSKENASQPTETGVVKSENVNYNLEYAQVTPGLGYKILKKMSVGVAPDFQNILSDNKPATTNAGPGNIQTDPVFDIGFMGKTEYSITENIKAGVSYRKGINNVLTASDRYIDHDYLQFQIKCAIFNK